MNDSCKRTYTLGKDPYGRLIFLVNDGGRLSIVRKADARHGIEARIDLTDEAVQNLKQALPAQ